MSRLSQRMWCISFVQPHRNYITKETYMSYIREGAMKQFNAKHRGEQIDPKSIHVQKIK